MKKLLLTLLLALAPFALIAQGKSSSDKSGQRALTAVRNGQFVALEVLIKDALERVPGEVIDIELDGDEYEIEVLDANASRDLALGLPSCRIWSASMAA